MYLPSDKLLEIQQLPHSLLHMQHIMVHMVIFFWGKITFCANGHAQLCQLCCVIQSNILYVYHSPTHLLSPFTFLFLNGIGCLRSSRFQSFCNFLFLPITGNATPNYWVFYFQGSGFPYPLMEPAEVSMHRVHIASQELPVYCTSVV